MNTYLWTIVIMIRRTMKTLQIQLSPLGLMEIGPNGNALGPSYLVCVLPYPLLPCRCAFFSLPSPLLFLISNLIAQLSFLFCLDSSEQICFGGWVALCGALEITPLWRHFGVSSWGTLGIR